MRARLSTLTLWMVMLSIDGCGQSVEQLGGEQTSTGGAGAASVSGTPLAGTSVPRSGTAGGLAAPMPGRNLMTAGSGAAGSVASSSGVRSAGAGAGGSFGTAGRAGAGVAGAAGTAGAATSAGAGGSAGAGTLPSGATNFVSVCEGGKVGMDSDAAMLRGLDIMREYAGVKMLIRSPNEVLSFKTTLQVPKPPTARQTLFIWPGLQSRDGAADPGRVGNGVLQPVLTWGPSCAPKRPSDPYASWWIAGMYVTLSSNIAGPTGCGGGDYLSGDVGDLLEIDMFSKDEKWWVTTIKNVQMNKQVDYTIDLRGQVQNEVMWLIEVPDGSSIRPADDTIWTQNVLTFKDPVTSCQPDRIGSGDYFSAPTLSPDGLHCCWDRIVMSAQR